jgi:CheY-like chemotaxis protein
MAPETWLSIVSFPPRGIASRAFTERLMMTCSTCATSASTRPRPRGRTEEKPWPIPLAEHSAVGNETVLLVEGEQSVRALVRVILQAKKYTVLEAIGGEDALRAAQRHPDPIHLLLTDVVMPVTGGPDLASRLRAVRPGIKVLFMSGYTDDAIVRNGLVAAGMNFLQKPFTPSGLAAKVREVLDS